MLCRWLGFDFIPASLAVLSNWLKHYYDKNEAAALIGKIAGALRSFQGLHWFSSGPFVQVTLLTGPLSPFTRRYSNFLIATWCFFFFHRAKGFIRENLKSYRAPVMGTQTRRTTCTTFTSSTAMGLPFPSPSCSFGRRSSGQQSTRLKMLIKQQ